MCCSQFEDGKAEEHKEQLICNNPCPNLLLLLTIIITQVSALSTEIVLPYLTAFGVNLDTVRQVCRCGVESVGGNNTILVCIMLWG